MPTVPGIKAGFTVREAVILLDGIVGIRLSPGLVNLLKKKIL